MSGEPVEHMEHRIATSTDDAGFSARCANHPDWFAWATGWPGLQPQVDEHVWRRSHVG